MLSIRNSSIFLMSTLMYLFFSLREKYASWLEWTKSQKAMEIYLKAYKTKPLIWLANLQDAVTCMPICWNRGWQDNLKHEGTYFCHTPITVCLRRKLLRSSHWEYHSLAMEWLPEANDSTVDQNSWGLSKRMQRKNVANLTLTLPLFIKKSADIRFMFEKEEKMLDAKVIQTSTSELSSATVIVRWKRCIC